jgi:hypothetical protein
MTSRKFLTKQWKKKNNSQRCFFYYLGMQKCQLGDGKDLLPHEIHSEQKIKFHGARLFPRKPTDWSRLMNEETDDY